MPGVLTESALRLGRPVWLLSVTWAGRTWRWSTEPVEVLTADGDTVVFGGGLDRAPVEDSLVEVSGAGSPRAASWEGLELDGVAALVAQGHELAQAYGELAVWLPGQTLEAAPVVLAGPAEIRHGADDEPVELTLSEQPWDDQALIPGASEVVGAYTWPTDPAENVEGRPYPIVFGAPGIYTATSGTSGLTTGSPGLVVNIVPDRTLLIAGHHVDAAAVQVFNVTANENDLLAVVNGYDGAGQPVAYVDLTGVVFTVDDDQEYFVRWRTTAPAAAPQYGLRQRDANSALRGAGDLLIWVLEQSTLPLDLGRWSAVRDPLNAYELAGYIDARVSPWQWVVDNLLPVLPISVQAGPRGLYPVLWRWRARASDAVAELEASPGRMVRAGPVEVDGDPIEEATLRFALKAHRSSYARRLTATWRATTAEEEYQDARLVRARSRYVDPRTGRSRCGSVELESDVIYSDTTAALVLSDVVASRASRARRITYDATVADGWRQLGDVVLLTDDELHLTGQLAIIDGIAWDAGDLDMQIRVRLLEDVTRDARVLP